jgi:glucose-6-phosphate isomerase
MGVELGKVLAVQIEDEIRRKEADETTHDCSTVALIKELL